MPPRVLLHGAAAHTVADTDLGYLPALGPGTLLLAATAEQYARRAGWPLRLDHVIAWHVRTALGGALWRSQAGIPLPRGTPPDMSTNSPPS